MQKIALFSEKGQKGFKMYKNQLKIPNVFYGKPSLKKIYFAIKFHKGEGVISFSYLQKRAKNRLS